MPMGEQDRINLKTINGKTGYKITKFQLISSNPGTDNEFVAKITKTDQTGSINDDIDFTDGDLLAIVYLKEGAGVNQGVNDVIIFDTKKFNQNIFINITDASGGTTPCNYYIELEAMSISDLEATMLTLQNIKTITE